MPPSTLSFVSHGARILARVEPAALRDELRAVLPPGSRIKAVPDPDVVYDLSRHASAFIVRRGPEELARAAALPPALASLVSDLHFQVARHARRKLFVHAGCVEWQGRAIVLPGRSMAGKSTLVEALVREGATYFSDEYAVLDRSGRVHPYRKDINLRGTREGPREGAYPANGGRRPGPVPLGLVVSTRYRPGARWAPVELSSGQALLSLLDNTVVARLRPRFAMSILGKAAAGTRGWAGDRGEASRVARRVLELPSTLASL